MPSVIGSCGDFDQLSTPLIKINLAEIVRVVPIEFMWHSRPRWPCGGGGSFGTVVDLVSHRQHLKKDYCFGAVKLNMLMWLALEILCEQEKVCLNTLLRPGVAKNPSRYRWSNFRLPVQHRVSVLYPCIVGNCPFLEVYLMCTTFRELALLLSRFYHVTPLPSTFDCLHRYRKLTIS